MAERDFNVPDVAQALGVHPETVRQWLRTRELRGYKLGGRAGWRVQAAELERFKAARSNADLTRERE